MCHRCADLLPWFTFACQRCAISLPSASTNSVCGRCLHSPPPYQTSTALFRYAEPVATLLKQLKFNGQLHYAQTFGTLLAQRLKYSEQTLPECIIPVPLHRKRQRQRGFNQAMEIARVCSKALAIKIDNKLAMRQRDTPAQSSLGAGKRRANIRGAFCLTKPTDYQHVALLDDVVTTGYTVIELAHLLKKAGVKRVDVWCIARADN